MNFSVPWDCSSIEELVMMIKSQPVRFNVKIPVSENSKDFILKCLQAKETKRFTFEMMFEHKLLVNHLNQNYNNLLFKNIAKMLNIIRKRMR